MISQECCDKVCFDVGVGNVLLTILALKHGARHVYAFEKNDATAEFFQNIIYGLNLQDKVTLIRDAFSLSKLTTYDIEPPSVIMHYMQHGQCWTEESDIFNAFDAKSDSIKFLPEHYGVEIKELPISNKSYNKMLTENNKFCPLDTGISDINDFENLYNEFTKKYYEIDSKIKVPAKLESWFLTKSETIANCRIDINNQLVRLETNINNQIFNFPLVVPTVQILTKHKESIIICNFYIKYKETKLILQRDFLLKNSTQKNVEINISNNHYVWLS
jgi:predicted RNA methylase